MAVIRQAIVRQLSGSCQAVITQMSGSIVIVVRQLSGIRQVVIWNSLDRLMLIIMESSADVRQFSD